MVVEEALHFRVLSRFDGRLRSRLQGSKAVQSKTPKQRISIKVHGSDVYAMAVPREEYIALYGTMVTSLWTRWFSKPEINEEATVERECGEMGNATAEAEMGSLK